MSLSHLYLDANLDVLDRFGFPKAEALDSLELGPAWMDNPADRLPIDLFQTLLDIASVRLNDPHIGLRMGHRFRISTFARTGSIYGYCRNLRQVIDMNARYQRLAIDSGEIRYDTEDGRHHMRFRPYYADHNGYRHITDLIMGAYGTAYRWLSWGSGEDLAGTTIPYDAPHETDLYDRIFQCPVEFGTPCGTASLVFSDAAMSQSLASYDPEKLTRAQAQLEALLNDKTAAASLEAAIDAAIRGAILSGRVTAHVVKARLGQDGSDLQSALKQSGQGFRERVDTVRQHMFIELQEQGLSFAQIAQALAYNDQPAFNRAFKRWYDMTPTAWLEQRQ